MKHKNNQVIYENDLTFTSSYIDSNIELATDNKSNMVLITGVTGQDGSYLAEFLLEKGYNVIGIARRCSHNNTERIVQILDNKKFKLVEGDITDYSNIFSIINEYRPYLIFNLASQSHVGTSFKQPLYTWDVTGKSVLNILEIIKSFKSINYNPRFYQASSSEIMGDQFDLDCNGQKIQSENTRMNPQSCYGVAKLAGYNLTRLYRKSYGMFACNGILFNHESPRRGDNFVTKKVAKYVGRLYKYRKDNQCLINRGKDLQYLKLKLGDLSASRDWGFAGDYIEAMWMMLQQDKSDDFVIATGKTHTVEEFVIEAFKHIEIENWKDYVEIDEGLKRPSEVPFLRGDAGKAKRVLNWESKVDFQGLVHMMVDYEIKGS